MSLIRIADAAKMQNISVQAFYLRMNATGLKTARRGYVDVNEMHQRFANRFEYIDRPNSVTGPPTNGHQRRPGPEKGSITNLKEGCLAVELRRKNLKLKREEGRFVDRNAVQSAWGSLIINAKNKLLSMGNRLGPLVASETEPVACKSIIDADIEEMLRGLSRFELPPEVSEQIA
jgi:hypothetical protein